MAPTPVDDILSVTTTPTINPDENYWKPSNIAFTAVASALTLGVILAAVAFFIYRHQQHKKLIQAAPAKESLLADEERKSSMFSRERSSSVTVYVDDTDTDTAYRRISAELAPLVPLHINTQLPVASAGSGVTTISRESSSSSSTIGTMMLSPASEGSRPAGRPRSTSSSSVRYYSVTPTDTTIPVPKIVRTISD